METLFRKNRIIVAIALIAALVIGAANAVVLASWRDYVTTQAQIIADQGETIAQQAEAIEILATGACYGYAANIRIDLAFDGTRTLTDEFVLDGKSFQTCLAILMDLTTSRQP